MATSNSITMLEQARKYFSHSLVLIDDAKDKKNVVPANLVRALWGLLRCCQQMKNFESKPDAKND